MSMSDPVGGTHGHPWYVATIRHLSGGLAALTAAPIQPEQPERDQTDDDHGEDHTARESHSRFSDQVQEASTDRPRSDGHLKILTVQLPVPDGVGWPVS
jgi:hypothetical protein